MTTWGSIFKRSFDIVLAYVVIVLTLPIMFMAFIVASVETKNMGLFIQKRIGREGKPFNLFKIKTMKEIQGIDTTITTMHDQRITKSGKFFRRTKIDELPQLFNILLGAMSFVGPRPDVKGYADKLEGEDRIILSIRPGLTGPASLKYRNEEEILAKQSNPKEYNDKVIWRDKVKINSEYIRTWSFKKDMVYIVKTILG